MFPFGEARLSCAPPGRVSNPAPRAPFPLVHLDTYTRPTRYHAIQLSSYSQHAIFVQIPEQIICLTSALRYQFFFLRFLARGWGATEDERYALCLLVLLAHTLSTSEAPFGDLFDYHFFLAYSLYCFLLCAGGYSDIGPSG